VTIVRPRSRALALAMAGSAVGAVLALTGCLNQASAPTNTTSASAPTSSSSAPSAPSASPSPTNPPGTPVTIACTSVLTPQQVYNYNPNYVATQAFKPGQGTLGATAVAASGRVCGWVNETSGVKLEVAVAQPAPRQLATLRSAATSGTAVQPGGSATGFFSVAGGSGTLQIFTGAYWIVLSSADIASQTDVATLATDVLGNLPKS
jgi:hypothetical protein